MHGVVMNETSFGIAVLFFNPHNIGEYAIVNVKRQDAPLPACTIQLASIESRQYHILYRRIFCFYP